MTLLEILEETESLPIVLEHPDYSGYILIRDKNKPMYKAHKNPIDGKFHTTGTARVKVNVILSKTWKVVKE